jgi:hypothetical protein
MTILTESILIESRTARDGQLAQISQTRAQEILDKVKSLYFAVWKGEGLTTTEQLADFYEIDTSATLRKILARHKSEFDSDGVKSLRGKGLKDVRDILSLTSTQANLTVWTPRAALRLGMLLQNSPIAQAVRASLLNLVEKVIPSQSQEIERLKLELQLAQTQERLLLTTQSIATMHGSQMVALILGKPEAIVTRTEKVETLVTVDNQGNAIAKYNGIGITYLAKRYGFGSNTKTCRNWLESIGVSESQWLTEPSLIKAQKLPREILPWLDRQYASRQGTRQSLLGE